MFTDEQKAKLERIGLIAEGLYSYINVEIKSADYDANHFVKISNNGNKTFYVFWHDKKAKRYRKKSGITFEEAITRVEDYLKNSNHNQD